MAIRFCAIRRGFQEQFRSGGSTRVDPAGNGHEPSIEFGRGCAVTDAQFNVRQNLCVPITIVVVTNRGDDLITVVMIYVPESHPQYN
jgi:hypothetical protein